MREEHTAMAVLDMMPAGIDALPPEASTTPRRLRPRGPQALPPTLGEEIDSLSGELLRTYEELHLLYDLGEALTGQLPLAAAAYLILDRIVNTLHPAWAELHLETRGLVTRVEHPRVQASLSRLAGPTHQLYTTLRSSGDPIGSIVLGQLRGDEPFSSADGKLLDAVGTLAANALRNAQLYEELMSQTDAVRQQEENLRTVIENVADGIATVNDEGLVESLNPAAVQLLGYREEEIVGRPFATLLAPPFAEDYQGNLSRWANRAHWRKGESGRREVTGRRKDGAARLLDMSINETRIDGRRLCIVSLHDITARKQFENVLEHRALHDQLTDLPNRVFLSNRLRQHLGAFERGQEPLALLLLDLDGFKEVNDAFGHHFGDLLLQEMGRRLQESLRHSDTIARLGGDEFAVVLPGASAATALHVSRKILQILAQPFELGGHTLGVGGSIGVAMYPDDGTDEQALLRCADVAMYSAKRAQSGSTLYHADQDHHSPARLAMVSDLRQAITGNELRLHYQPKIARGTGRLDCVEALVRWQHPRQGLLSPEMFVSLAERTQLIQPLSLWILNAALAQCRAWNDVGLRIPVAVNLSPRNLQDADLTDQLPRLLSAWGVPPEQLRLEITENSLLRRPEQTIDILTKLRSLGIQTAVDDFGKGYSSLSYITRLPINEIKIDQSFVGRMRHNDANRAIVRSTIGLGHDLGLVVTAEGVEDEETWELLDALGCDIAQGFHVGRPMDAEALAAWLRQSSWSPAGAD
jgi:diguanylate cyclase (GGDEF)-like protein/PAS domain S-box-containing protein